MRHLLVVFAAALTLVAPAFAHHEHTSESGLLTWMTIAAGLIILAAGITVSKIVFFRSPTNQ